MYFYGRKKNTGFLTMASSLVVLLSLLIVSTSVSAHEIFYDGYGPGFNAILIKWGTVTSGKATMKMNGDYLDANYSSHYSTIRSAWPNASAKVSITNSSFSTSNVDLATATQTAWNNRWGTINARNVLGVADLSSTDGIALTTAANARKSSKRMKYAGILFTPFKDYTNDTNRRNTMVHEIGHALGLGHPNTSYYPTSAASVMRQATTETYYTPRSHDITDIANKY